MLQPYAVIFVMQSACIRISPVPEERMFYAPAPRRDTVVLAGMESSGKSTLFRSLTNHATGDEANFRGSTVICRRALLTGGNLDVVDTPGIRVTGDALTTRLALTAAGTADVILLVVRAVDLQGELSSLLEILELSGKKTALILTFADLAEEFPEETAAACREQLGIPVVALNARLPAPASLAALREAITWACEVMTVNALPPTARVLPAPSLFDRPRLGPLAALAALLLFYAVPVFLAYHFASVLQPWVDARLIEPSKAALAWLPVWPAALLTGSYGLLTLGWYSFLWAFPVVVLISLAMAFTEETGLQDRITRTLDPALRRIGLSGRDLQPVITGFGCNVVAVLQSRSCSRCTRTACISLISFGSACSYQIGASLSIFGVAGHPGLFLPYLGLLFVTGAIHTRLWHGTPAAAETMPRHEAAFLQAPRLRAMAWRVRGALRQFLFSAMPVFLLICLAGAALQQAGWIDRAAKLVEPVLRLLSLPEATAAPLLFSIIRKDGLLTINQNGGALPASLSAGQVFLMVWLCSTLTSCLVTLWTIRRELGFPAALRLASHQALTSLSTTAILALFLHWHPTP
jgi:Fe2+ transport system protein B